MSELIISSSPHIRSNDSSRRIMIHVLVALLPATLSAYIYFGVRSLVLTAVSIAACVISEYGIRKLLKRDMTIQDMSAVVTGWLLALNLPPQLPVWMAVFGGFLAIVLVKQLFGGIGQNFMNPALTARVILLISFAGPMTRWAIRGDGADLITTATPLALLKEAGGRVLPDMPKYIDLLLGNVGGCIGETSALALLLGGLYLLVQRVISPVIPLSFLGTTLLFTWAAGGPSGIFTGDGLYHILSGGILLGAFFMATDYSTSPITTRGKWIMGVGCGLLTGVIRLFAGYPEGVSFAILIMNILVPLIDRYTLPKPFGTPKKGGGTAHA